MLPKIRVEIVVAKVPVGTVVEAAKKVLHTGRIGDGKIFVESADLFEHRAPGQAAGEGDGRQLVGMPEGAVVVRMLSDYAVLRDQARACR